MTNKMSISYLLNPETSINDLPHEILDKIKNMVPELQLQDHKNKYQHTLNAIPVVTKVLWTWSCIYVGGPIKIKCIHHDADDDDEWRVDEVEKFIPEIDTNLNYFNIRHELTKSTYYHERQDAMTPML